MKKMSGHENSPRGRGSAKTLNQNHVFVIVIVILLLVLVVACALLCGGGYYLYNRTIQSAHSARFAKHIGEYMAVTKEVPDTEAYVRGKIVVIDVRTKAVDDDVFHALPASLRAATPEEVGTVVRIKWGVKFVGHFERGGRDVGSASAVRGEVTVIDKSIPAILETHHFESSNVVRGIDGGDKPIREIVDFLSKLPRKGAKKK